MIEPAWPLRMPFSKACSSSSWSVRSSSLIAVFVREFSKSFWAMCLSVTIRPSPWTPSVSSATSSPATNGSSPSVSKFRPAVTNATWLIIGA